jgi:glycerophosphoryl diester phosphodiesterase
VAALGDLADDMAAQAAAKPRLIRPGTPQTNDRSLSPVAVAFAERRHLIDPYVDPTTQQLFDFVRFYVHWYKDGPGKDTPGAEQRWKNAAGVRFNIETKLNPRSDTDQHGNRYRDRTFSPERITRAVAGVIERNHMQRRADVQSFDFRTLRIVHREFPNLLTVALFDDEPRIAPGNGEGTNLQPEDGEPNTRWLAGLYWPYRQTAQTNPFRVEKSGGFEGMAMTPDRRTLIPILEKPLADGPADRTTAFALDVRSGRYTGERWFYPYDPRGVSVPDFQLADRRHGIAIERDNTQGDLSGFKALEDVTLGAPGTTMVKSEAADLLRIADPALISLPAQPGDVGLGNPFAMPFITIEDVWVLDRRHVLVINDNNFPFSVGRHVGSGAPDDNEFVVLRLPQPITPR